MDRTGDAEALCHEAVPQLVEQHEAEQGAQDRPAAQRGQGSPAHVGSRNEDEEREAAVEPDLDPKILPISKFS